MAVINFYCRRLLCVMGLSILLAGCGDDLSYAPVSAIAPPKATQAGLYRVNEGDTLYSIAWANGVDYRTLAQMNNLSPPYQLRSGQWLRVHHPKTARPMTGTATATYTWVPPVKPAIVHTAYEWQMPAKGKIINYFSEASGGNKGIDIAGRYGETVRATDAGEVVYSGAGVRAYGNLIIIKHSNSYLSAYGFNERNLVKQGTKVAAGEPIALMGRNDAGRALLHFEIRWNGKPVNPLSYIRSS